jgi:hypothetical protein
MDEILPGQVWVCAAAGDLPPLLCIIGKIDVGSDLNSKAPSKRIVSLTITPHPIAKKDGWPSVSHLPIFEEAFRNSNFRLAKTGVESGSGFEAGYLEWASVFREGKAGAFNLSVGQAYEGVISVSRSQRS